MKSFGTIINSLKERSFIQRQGEPVLCRSSISTVRRIASFVFLFGSEAISNSIVPHLYE